MRLLYAAGAEGDQQLEEALAPVTPFFRLKPRLSAIKDCGRG